MNHYTARTVLDCDSAAMAHITYCCDVRTGAHDDQWLDVTPMVSLNEYSAQAVDANQQCIDYALSRGLIERHPCIRHLIRVAPRA